MVEATRSDPHVQVLIDTAKQFWNLASIRNSCKIHKWVVAIVTSDKSSRWDTKWRFIVSRSQNLDNSKNVFLSECNNPKKGLRDTLIVHLNRILPIILIPSAMWWFHFVQILSLFLYPHWILKYDRENLSDGLCNQKHIVPQEQFINFILPTWMAEQSSLRTSVSKITDVPLPNLSFTPIFLVIIN